MSDIKINKMFDKIKDSHVLDELLSDAVNAIGDVKIEMQEIGNGAAAETLPTNKIIINDDIDANEVDDFIASRLIHEISHALNNDNYLDRPEEARAFFVQVRYLLEQGKTPAQIKEFLLPIFKNFKSKRDSSHLIDEMIELAKKQNHLAIKHSKVAKTNKDSALPSNVKIVVVGDSIAVGTGRYIPNAIVDAEVGISTSAIASKASKNKDLLDADVAIISAGTNDYPIAQGGKNPNVSRTLSNIQSIRASLRAKKYIWLLPYNRQAASDIKSVVSGDIVLDLKDAASVSKDQLHPSSYSSVASAALSASGFQPTESDKLESNIKHINESKDQIKLDNKKDPKKDSSKHDDAKQQVAPTSSRDHTNKHLTATEVQRALHNLGYDLGPAGVDGIQGSATTAAIKSFQADHQLKVDGIVGPRTTQILNQLIANATDTVANSYRVVKYATSNQNIVFTPEEKIILEKVKAAASSLSITAYLAGGIIRDKLLGKPNQDLDFVADKDSAKLAALLAKTYKLSDPVHMDRSGATMIRLDDKFIDFIDAEKVYRPVTADYLEQGQEGEMSIFMDDAYRRDLTMNSLMFNLETGKLIDPTDKGFADLNSKVIRTIIDPHLKYRIHAPDMLRALRFYATNDDFVFAPEMLEAMKENAHRVTPRDKGGDISSRRIERELRKASTTPESWIKMKAAMTEVGLPQYIGEQIQAVDEDRQGDIEYNFDKQSFTIPGLTKFSQSQLNEAFIEGPQVQIDPSIQKDIQQAVNDLRRMDPNIFRGVGRIVALTGGPFGQVASTDPTTVHINLNRIKQQVQQQLGSQYKPSNPSHKQAFEEALKRSIVETISHEVGHVKDFDSEAGKFKGGESPAESTSHQTLQRLYQNKPIILDATQHINKQAILVQKVNPKTDKKEWALVSKKDRDKVLEWYGTRHPSEERIQHTEKRVQYFKNRSAAVKPFTKRTPEAIHDVSRLIRRWKEIVYNTTHPTPKAELSKALAELKFIEQKLQELGMSKESLQDLAHLLHTQRISNNLHITKHAKPEEVVSIALIDEDSNLLVGTRTDDNTYALPGGHLEQDETPSEAITREVQEEAELEVDEADLSYLGLKSTTKPDSNTEVLVHSFAAPLKQEPSDTEEMTDWQLISAIDSLPSEIKSNLHNKDNDITLQFLKLQPELASRQSSVNVSKDSSLSRQAAEFNHMEVPSEDITPAYNVPLVEPYKDSYATPRAPRKKSPQNSKVKSSATQLGVPDDNLSSPSTLRAPYDVGDLTPRESILQRQEIKHFHKKRRKKPASR